MSKAAGAVWGAVALTAVAFPGPAVAQETADGEQAPKVQQVRAIERGWFVQADIGLTHFVGKIDDRKYGPGPQVGVFLGYDLLPILNVSVGASFWGGEVDAAERSTADRPAGDLVYVVPALRAQVAVFTTQRNFLWVRGDVGYALGTPREIDGFEYAQNGPLFGVTVGFERYTKLRHFALGINAGVVLLTAPNIVPGITVTPTLKYTF